MSNLQKKDLHQNYVNAAKLLEGSESITQKCSNAGIGRRTKGGFINRTHEISFCKSKEVHGWYFEFCPEDMKKQQNNGRKPDDPNIRQ